MSPTSRRKRIEPIGPKARHLNRDYRYADGGENQLAHLVQVGYLSGVPAPARCRATPTGATRTQPLDARARAYLDINCGALPQRAAAPANTTGLTLDAGAPATASSASASRRSRPARAPATTSSTSCRASRTSRSCRTAWRSTEPGVMMPELGRGTVHREGLALIRTGSPRMPGELRGDH